MKRNITVNDVYLLRCIIIKVNANNFEGKDYNGKKYTIAKNEVTKNFELGTDSSFYAIKKEQGLFFKKEVVHPLSKGEYEKLLSKTNQAMNIEKKSASQ